MDTRYPTYRQLQAELAKKNVRPLYLFIGEDEAGKEKAVRAIAALVCGKSDSAGMSVGRYRMELDEFLPAAGFAVSSSMFSEKKVCIMLNIESIRSSAENTSVMREMLTGLPEGTVLVMTSAENRVPGIIQKEMLAGIAVYHFWRPFANDMLAHVRKELTSQGIVFEEDAVSLLVERTGRDVSRLDDALEKIRNFAAGGTLSADDVRDMVYDDREATVYEFADQLLRMDRQCFGTLKALLDGGVPDLAILGNLIRQAEALERYHGMMGGGANPEEVFARLGIPQRKRSAFEAAALGTTPERLCRLFGLLARADFGLKSVRGSKNVIANPLFDLTSEYLGRS